MFGSQLEHGVAKQFIGIFPFFHDEYFELSSFREMVRSLEGYEKM